jgi:putative phosphoesterase
VNRRTEYAFRPADIPAEHIVACLGLISDTHMPERCEALPAALPTIFRDVDLILHAGDVGKLWVLDRLSSIAPVIAVHGNDDTPEAQRELPYQQVIVIGGQRIFLSHCHYPDRAEEMESRRDDSWKPKLERRLEFGRRAGASTVIFGHTHIPMTYREDGQDGILLVNPGAVASGSPNTRQLRQSVALLFLCDDRAPVAVHVDVNAPDRPFVPEVDWNAGFRAALKHYEESILAPELVAVWPRAVQEFLGWLDDPACAPLVEGVREATLRVARRCWSGKQQYMSRADLLRELATLRADPAIPGNALDQFEAIIS